MALSIATIAAGVLAVTSSISSLAADVLVGRNQVDGTGANLQETRLNVGNVRLGTFGKLFAYEVDGALFAQPLLASGLTIGGKKRNVVFVATTNSSVYALDADDPSYRGGWLWHTRLTRAGELSLSLETGPGQLVQGSIGILGTPVIDRSRNALYVVARTTEGRQVRQYLHALDLTTGRDKVPPRNISASTSNADGTFVFDPRLQNQRAGLTLALSSVIVAWSSLQDDGDYRGWVMAFDADSLSLSGVFCSTCGGPARLPWLGGGVWQSGRPPSVDAQGFVYVFTGNGWNQGKLNSNPEGRFMGACPAVNHAPDGFPPKPTGYYAESLVKLDPAHGLKVVGSWTPWNWCDLDRKDQDLGGSGPVLMNVGGAPLIVGGGKDGVLYSFDAASLTVPDRPAGGRPVIDCNNDTGLVFMPNPADPPSPLRDCFLLSSSHVHGQPPSCAAGSTDALCASDHHVMGGPVFWPRSAPMGGSRVFVSSENERVRRYAVSAAGVVHDADAQSASRITGHPAAILSLSADRDVRGSGILWMTYATRNAADLQNSSAFYTKHGTLAAYDAAAVPDASGSLPELWNSERRADGGDRVGYFAKFNPPTIANGKVYVAAFPAPEWYRNVEPAKAAAMADYSGSYTSPNSVGYLVVYGLDPPAVAPVRSFSADLAPTVVAPLLLLN